MPHAVPTGTVLALGTLGLFLLAAVAGVPWAVLVLAGLSLGYTVSVAGWYALFLVSPLVLLGLSHHRYATAQKEHARQLEGCTNELVDTLTAVVDARDLFTYGHSTQVARYAVAMAMELGYDAADLERLRVGALLHDIGKVGVPEAILYKPGSLEPWEYRKMQEHASIGYGIVSKMARLRYAAQIIYQHHEWFNGQGYPQGLVREHILRDARIVGVADALEAMMSDRPYRQGRTLAEALAEIRRCSGTQFDPEVVGALERVVEQQGNSFFVNASHQQRVAAAELH